MQRAILSIILSWLIFIGIDFLFHAGILTNLWDEEIAAFKSKEELARLIPVGYLSFLLLTALIGYVFFNFFKTKPKFTSVVQFGLIFGILFALSNQLGLYSFIDMPFKQSISFNLVYFVEIFFISLSLYYLRFSVNWKRTVLYTILIFIGLVILGILIQNVIANL